MTNRTLSLVLALVLLASACADPAVDDVAGGPDVTTTDPTVTTSPTDADPVTPEARGWLEGDDLDWSGDGDAPGTRTADFDMADAEGDEGGDSAEGSTASTTVADGIDAATESSSEELFEPIPPVDNSPLRAGSIDDAEDVAAFLEHRTLITDAGVVVRPLDLSDSTVFTVIGGNGLPVLDALVEFHAPDNADQSNDPVLTLRTTADGSVRFAPAAMAALWADLDVVVRIGDEASDVDFEWGSPAVEVTVEADGGIDGSVPLDIHFVLDATGSMSDEIARLRDNMTAIATQISALPSAPDVRFGMTVYRDEGDLFVTRTFDLTDDLAEFLTALDDVVAAGGGDYPEALDEALADALEKPSWLRDGAVELMFVIADAPPHVDRDVQQPYTETAIAAAQAGVKIFPVAASGTDDQAEYAMRDVAFVTGGRFVFLSYGAGGSTATGDRTDITADDYDELPLDQLVIRLVQDELAALSGESGQTQPTTTTTPVTTTTFDQ